MKSPWVIGAGLISAVLGGLLYWNVFRVETHVCSRETISYLKEPGGFAAQYVPRDAILGECLQTSYSGIEPWTMVSVSYSHPMWTGASVRQWLKEAPTDETVPVWLKIKGAEIIVEWAYSAP